MASHRVLAVSLQAAGDGDCEASSGLPSKGLQRSRVDSGNPAPQEVSKRPGPEHQLLRHLGTRPASSGSPLTSSLLHPMFSEGLAGATSELLTDCSGAACQDLGLP